MRLFLFLIVAIALVPVDGIAQQPPPAGTSATNSPLTDRLGQILFDAAEQKAIEVFYGHLPAGTAGEIMKEVVGRVSELPASASTDPTNETIKSNGKSKKNKNKGKNNNGKNAKKMPPGLSKRDALPPGLQNQLEQNGTLPPGLTKRQLPHALENQLPPPQAGTERVITGNDVVLIHRATGVVLDILKDIVTN